METTNLKTVAGRLQKNRLIIEEIAFWQFLSLSGRCSVHIKNVLENTKQGGIVKCIIKNYLGHGLRDKKNMPRVTQYIRNGDMEKWKAVPNKSEFIHNALNPIGRAFKPSREVITKIEIPKSSTGFFCKHGADPKYCKFAKPGKPYK